MGQRIIDRSYVGEVLHHMYTSDIDMAISLISKNGYYYIGINDDKRIPLPGTSIEEAVTHMAFRLAKEFPASKFATWWGNNFREEDFKVDPHSLT
jgi:hypothetical protein